MQKELVHNKKEGVLTMNSKKLTSLRSDLKKIESEKGQKDISDQILAREKWNHILVNKPKQLFRLYYLLCNLMRKV